MKKKGPIKSKTNKNLEANLNRYEQDYKWKPRNIEKIEDVRTTVEMLAFLESDNGKGIELDARVMAHNPELGFGMRNLGKKSFIEHFKKNSSSRKQFRETFSDFSRGGSGSGFANTVGNDFTPLLGGPFYKQMYYYSDWLKMHQDCFFAYHHDPLGKATVEIMTDFTLGKGFRVEFENEVAQALWDAFEIANDFQDQFRDYARELSAYGENLLWWLPNNERYIVFPRSEINIADVPKVVIPRIRVIDPSNIVEIITYPEDLTRKLAYVWMTPTQYQIYTGKDEKTGKVVNSSKFIYQQIPASQIMHHKLNAASNEKRGRSDLFAALAYFKRLRDSVNYEIIAQQKNAAWAIDTTIEGDETDIANYMQDQASLGTIPNAGSEFVHTKAIQRQYLGNQGAAKGISMAFEWCLSMVAAATRIPISYYGTHLSGGQTRGSAIVATEPVAKFFEMRQEVLKGIIRQVANRMLQHFNIQSDFDVKFPEIITQDRSAKLKDVYLAETAGWICPERAAETAASELGFRDFDWETEKQKIAEQKSDEPPIGTTPLTQPSTAPGPVQEKPGATTPAPAPVKPTSAVTSQDKKGINDNR